VPCLSVVLSVDKFAPCILASFNVVEGKVAKSEQRENFVKKIIYICKFYELCLGALRQLSKGCMLNVMQCVCVCVCLCRCPTPTATPPPTSTPYTYTYLSFSQHVLLSGFPRVVLFNRIKLHPCWRLLMAQTFNENVHI